MLKKTVTYTDFNDREQTEDLYFNLTKSELMQSEMLSNGSFSKKLEEISQSEDPAQILQMFKEIIKMAYGVKSQDGRHFLKNDEVWTNFEQSAAFDAFLFELMTQTDVAIDFANGLVPPKLREEIEAAKRRSDIHHAMPQDYKPKQGSTFEKSPTIETEVAPVEKTKIEDRPVSDYTEEELIALIRQRSQNSE